MGVISNRSAKLARRVAELASTGPVARFDLAAAELEPEAKELALLEVGRRLRLSEERNTHLSELAKAFQQLEEVAAYRAVVLDVREADSAIGARVCVALVGQPTQLVAGLLPPVRPEELEPGDEVELVPTSHAQYGIRRRVGRYLPYGAVARVEAIQDESMLRVHHGPETLFLRSSASLARELAELGEHAKEALGRRVSFDPGLGMAFAFLGKPDREDFLLRDFPRVERKELILDPRLERFLEEEILLPEQNEELALLYGVEAGRFLIFYGPTGVGKTYTARWIASELKRPLYLICGGELADPWYGGSEAKLRARLEAARAESDGAVVVWDEAESQLVERGRSVVGVEDRIVSLMLSFTDGFVREGKVLVILTTNRPDQIDSALKRQLRGVPVRFGRPDAVRTRRLFELYLGNALCAEADAEALASDAVRAVFAEREPIAEAVLRDGGRLPVQRRAAISGAFVRAACERALRLAFVRHVRGASESPPRGILRQDLLHALDEQFASVASDLTPRNLLQMAELPALDASDVVAVEPQSGAERGRYLCDPA